jgi:SAM-dependent methyltransferase
MLREEADWLADKLDSLEAEKVYPLLNIGSSSRYFREREQPWIDRVLFKPARDKGYRVIHTDLKKAPGVDIVGDLNEREFLERIAAMGIGSVLCSNLLEHLPDREKICRHISSIVPVNGYLFLTVPYRFPLHLDPIDTLFRPDIERTRQLFPDLEIVHGEIVAGGKLFRSTNVPAPLYLAIMLARSLLPLYRPLRWIDSLRYGSWLFRDISVTCIVFRQK